MSWSEYVEAHRGADVNRVIAAKVGVTESNVSRWRNGDQTPRADLVAKFARAYGRPVLEAFMAAGFLTADEANARPAAAPEYSQLSNDDLLKLVRQRMREDGEGHDQSPAPISEPSPAGDAGHRGGGGDTPPSITAVTRTSRQKRPSGTSRKPPPEQGA